MTRMKLATSAGLVLGAVAMLNACTPAKPPAEAAGAAPTAKPAFSINEMMVMIVDRPGELLWNVEKPGKAPKSDEGWYQLENHAVEVAVAGQVIKLGGTGPKDMEWAADPKWQSSADQLIAAAQHARAAAKAKDMSQVVAANGEIVDACEACHKVFKPDIPTGGLFMHTPALASDAKS